MTTVIDTAAIESRSLSVVDRVKVSKITDAATYTKLAEDLKIVNALLREIDAELDPNIDAWHKGHKAACAQKTRIQAPLKEAKAFANQQIAAFDEEQERLRRAEQLRLEAEARKREEDARLAEAAQLERAGDHEAAAQVIDAPVDVPAVVMPRATPKIAGISTRETWGAQVIDRVALIKHVAAHPELVHLLEPNMTALNQQARSLKGQMRLPGVRAVATRTVASGVA